MEGDILILLLRCRECGGAGRVGVIAGNVIYCEGCDGQGLAWREQGFMDTGD